LANRIRFHLDEHVDPAVAIALRRAGIDATTTNEAGLRTRDDQSQLAFARVESRVIVTRDHDFFGLTSVGEGHPGIAFYVGTKSIREII